MAYGGMQGLGFGTADRSQRSVFVGNIPYEATDEDMREVFQQVGPVLSFRLVHDRETGKPKGYGFCEYMDAETAMSAMRNLNNQEFRGRTLRVDSATGDKTREELAQLSASGPPLEESAYGPPIDPERAPEAISRAVAALPPEQMFELMKQMKLCIQNNPNEARNMLLQNPQLAYALLQAQVVMRIVDPQVALAMLHRDSGGPPHPPVLPPFGGPGPMRGPGPGPGPGAMGGSGIGGPGSMAAMMPGGAGPAPRVMNPMNVPPRGLIAGGPPMGGMMDPDYRSMQSSFPGSGPAGMMRGMGPGSGLRMQGAGGTSPDEQEKAQLIMQVLQLTDEQIALLPPDQRQSVLLLKEQLRNA